jgi:Ca2+-binding RTX toxin-like protein
LALGINLNADDDADVAFDGVTYIYLIGSTGADHLSTNGGLGTGDSTSLPVSLWGGQGNDRLVGGRRATFIRAGPDRDVLLGKDGKDVLLGQGGSDVLRGGHGNDDLAGGPGIDHCDDVADRNESRSCEL